MTAMNVILGSTMAFVLSDSAMYRSETAELDHFGRKVAIAEGAGVIVATRGDYRLAPCLAEAFEEAYSNIDDVKIDECQNLCWRYDQTIEEAGFQGTAHAQFALVGWSEEEDKPIGFAVALGDDGWTFNRIDRAIAGPVPGPTELSQLRLVGAAPGVDWTPDTFDPLKHGIAMLEAQRRMKLSISPTSGKVHTVGGEVTLTKLTKDGISQEVIHSWDDEIGTLIRAEPFLRPVVEGLSRQQRRALERENSRSIAKQARRA